MTTASISYLIIILRIGIELNKCTSACSDFFSQICYGAVLDSTGIRLTFIFFLTFLNTCVDNRALKKRAGLKVSQMSVDVKRITELSLKCGEGNGKVHPTTGHEGRDGGVEV